LLFTPAKCRDYFVWISFLLSCFQALFIFLTMDFQGKGHLDFDIGSQEDLFVFLKKF